jgi:hypothetical protein
MDIKKVEILKSKCFSLKFIGAEILYKYSNKKLSQICNGIGADWFPEKVRNIATWIFNYLEATAFLHDVEFDEQISFSLANSHFLQNGRIEILNKFSWYNPMRYIALRRLKQFYILLQTFGLIAYNQAGDKDK